ncbi:ferredoxin [Methanofervidicoccus sp. A16]|uniref:4Fe-4S binding protein n=1 Tax=Methanofervidicoccus sp. A16 TaxID=2607662 RepID=UPI00118ADB11|nr:4Fe-4S binding protein [Methanofervidicoccus sp. A16]AXI25093.1 ferredoxin [Methanofervidicoccus sp. A16]
MKVLDRCIGCGNCVPFCPFGAISSYGRAIISRDLCRECKLCIKYCPIDAIVDK